MTHRHPFLPLFAIVLLLAGCAGGMPKPTDSAYFRTAGGGFMVDLEEDNQTVKNLFYHLVLEPIEPVTQPLYLRAHFPDPAALSKEMLVDETVAPGATQVVIRSPRLKRIERGETYPVRIEIFADAGHTQRLGVHEQEVYSGADIDDKVHP